jgi:hypothetical protein
MIIRLFFIKLFDAGEALPEISHDLMQDALRAVCRKPKTGRPAKAAKAWTDALRTFSLEHLHLLAEPEQPDGKGLDVVLAYLTSDVVQSFQTNVAQHFAQYVECLVDAEFSVKGKTKRRCRRVKRRWRNRSVKPKANVYGQYHLRASRRTARSGLRRLKLLVICSGRMRWEN